MNKYNPKLLKDEMPNLYKLMILLHEDEYKYNPYTNKYKSLNIITKEGFRVKIEQLREVASSTGFKYLKLIEITEKEAMEYLKCLILKKHKEDIKKELIRLKELEAILSEIKNNM